MFVSNYVCIISCLQAWSSAFSFAILENLQSWIFLDYLFTHVWHFINVYIKWHAHCTRTFCILPFLHFSSIFSISHFFYLLYTIYLYWFSHVFSLQVAFTPIWYCFIYLFISAHFSYAISCLSTKINLSQMIKFDVWSINFTLTISRHL